MKRYIRASEERYDEWKYAYLIYNPETGIYRVYDSKSDELLKETSKEDVAYRFGDRYDEEQHRSVGFRIDYHNWQDIYDYYYDLAISRGDGEEYAHAYASGQADMQVLRR